jgi:hypothetical protein
MVKQVSFVRRAADVDPASFPAVWAAEAEHRLESLAPGARPSRLIHYVVRDRRGDAPHHGVAMSWFADRQALATSAGSSAGDRASSITVQSAAPVLVEERCVQGGDWLDEHSGHGDGPALVLVGLIQRAPHLSRPAFAEHWWSRHRPLVDALVPAEVQPLAYVHNYVLPGEPGEWDGIGEIYESSLDVPRRRGEWLEKPEIVADEQRFLVRSTRTVLVTDRWVVVG